MDEKSGLEGIRWAQTLARLARIDPELSGPMKHRGLQANLPPIRARAGLALAARVGRPAPRSGEGSRRAAARGTNRSSRARMEAGRQWPLGGRKNFVQLSHRRINLTPTGFLIERDLAH